MTAITITSSASVNPRAMRHRAVCLSLKASSSLDSTYRAETDRKRRAILALRLKARIACIGGELYHDRHGAALADGPLVSPAGHEVTSLTRREGFPSA